ncbi:MAG TPA: bifunctional aminotransferase class I/II-fold pyridoxal phosphate-dependent enzyme/GNAT family N-acetyltransferase [Ohtaekwangia sp.]|uniref:bifunctional aminotransferase class I/II-fold pyridoxal phosphate-dependent enzyme/GNAT family N-acetyltransferase n=1 Tax=Ohtaekwangia sp. TaxID=2066019 RepID=UPI002F93E6F6
MAKFKHNSFLDTVDEVFSDAIKSGVLHLYSEDSAFTGRHIRIGDQDLYHFGTTGYLGLEQDPRLKLAAIDAIEKYGTQFPLSKSYVSFVLYRALEERLFRMYNNPIVVTKNSTLGHIGVIPCAVRDEDGVIIDHQAHWSMHNACQLLKPRGIPVELIRHSNLDMLEDKIKELSRKCDKIWYMADGIYSMYGDCAPIPELMYLYKKYPQLHLYFDDVHGMSWVGKNGTGYVMDQLKTLPERVLLFGTLSKSFGASGAVLVTSDPEMHRRIKTFGGPLTFSAQLEPASVAAACASADIHLSDEIYRMQQELADNILYFNVLLSHTDLPLLERNNCPVFYIGTGMPVTGYNFVNRLMKEGFFVNLGIYPGVPVKNTGVRLTISRHNQRAEMKALVEAMVYHYPKALAETETTMNKVRRAFHLPIPEQSKDIAMVREDMQVQYETSIEAIDKNYWNEWMGKKSVFDWDGLRFLEQVFCSNEKEEHNWTFHYFIIRDKQSNTLIVTFFCRACWKDDMLAPAAVSRQIEEKRQQNPYYLTSTVLGMGSLFSEGDHCYINKTYPAWNDALRLLLDRVEILDESLRTSMIVLRDFQPDESLNEFFHNQGFIKVDMPESCVVENMEWNTHEEYLSLLSARSRKHFRSDIQPYENYFDIEHKQTTDAAEIHHFYTLYENVRSRNYDLNTFTFPEKLFTAMASHPQWEFIVLYLKNEHDTRAERKAVGVMFCYKNLDYTYVPSFIGMDYDYIQQYQLYRQLLYQTIRRARQLNFRKIDFGMTASFEKKKVGATVTPKVAYVQPKDNFSFELIGGIQNKPVGQ